MKLFPYFGSIPFDYLLLSWVMNYVSNLGFLTCLSRIVSIENSHSLKYLAHKVQNFSDFFGKIPVRILLDALLCVQVF